MPSLREVIDANLGQPHGQAIIDAAKNAGIAFELNEEGTLDIADALALVYHESRGVNIFGWDWGEEGVDEVPFAHMPVTRERVQALLAAIEEGYASNGIGLTQLTYPALIYRAEERGGAHVPEHQLSVGFELLVDLVDRLGYVLGIAAYNAGESNPRIGIDNGYYDAVQDAREMWKGLLSGIDLDTGKTPNESGGSKKVVTARDIVNSARKLLGIWYYWWQEGDPLPIWSYAYPGGVPPYSWFVENGTMCSDLLNYARMDNGLEPIGGTPAYYDFAQASGLAQEFDASTPGVPGAFAVNPGPWRGDTVLAQGHVVLYTDAHTLIQATDGAGSFAGVNEGEQDYDSVGWANYWTYCLMPDVDYSEFLGNEAHDPVAVPIPRPRWISIDASGWYRADGPDWSKGWHWLNDDGTLGPYKGPGDA